jgi:ligand-binding sensor domain-containing protein
VGEAVEDVGGLWPDSNGQLWLARPGELLRWENGVLSRHSTSNAWGGHKVKQLVQDARGNLWAATGGSVQLHRFADGQFTSYGRADGIRNVDDLRRLLPDREGNLWVGTGGGLHRLQPRRLVSLLTGSLSAMDEVYSVAPGRDGRVWLTTTYGLLKFQNDRFSIYSNDQSLRPNDPQRVRPPSNIAPVRCTLGSILRVCRRSAVEGSVRCPVLTCPDPIDAM